jgi:hypothetical protein
MTQTTPQPPAFELAASRQFPAWLAEQRLSLAFTTYQVGKLFLRGLHLWRRERMQAAQCGASVAQTARRSGADW